MTTLTVRDGIGPTFAEYVVLGGTHSPNVAFLSIVLEKSTTGFHGRKVRAWGTGRGTGTDHDYEAVRLQVSQNRGLSLRDPLLEIPAG